MSHRTNPLYYRIYLLTIWAEPDQDHEASQAWRFSLKDPRSGQQRSFANLTELIMALHSELIENHPDAPAAEALPLTPEQKFLIQKSFTQILPLAETVALIFYERLFELDPSLKAMFKGDISAQSRKLMQTLKLAVHNLNRWDELVPMLQLLGRQHAGYGVTEAHYDRVAEALLWAMAEGIGPDFTPEVAAAWTEMYTLLAGVMQTAAAEIELSSSLG